MAKYIEKQAVIMELKTHWNGMVLDVFDFIRNLPSADVVNKTDLLGWLFAYQTKSLELHGRYMPHEVISWLINDMMKSFIGERGEQDG